MPNLIDRLVGWVDPHRGLSRHFARQRLARAYEAANPADRWKPRRAGASANADHQADASRVRHKARSLAQNVPYIRSGMDALVAATIGTGIMPRATGKDAKRVNALFKEWGKVCDADGRLDYFGFVAAAYRAMEVDGEVMVRLRPRLSTDGLPVPLQLQLLEIDWLDSGKTTPAGSGGTRVVNGIEYDALGRVAAYWLWDSHPGDVSVLRSMRSESRRVEARNIIHLFSPERPGQGRGFSRLAPVIARVRDLSLYEDSEIARKNLESRLGVVYSGDPSLMANPAADADGTSTAPDVNAGNLGDLPSGSMVQIPMGSQVTVIEPKPAPGYVDYVKYQLHLVAAGMGVTYEMLTGDMREVNFSSARVRLLDFRRNVEQVQWLTLVPRLLEPLHRAFIDAAILGGQLRSRDYTCEFSTPKWDYVNPQQDVASDIAECSVGLSSISEKLRRRGYNPDDVYAEIARDKEKFQELGILEMLMVKEKGRTLEPQAPAVSPQPSMADPA